MSHATLTGEPIRISVRQDLCCAHGRIVDDDSGTPVHAATFIRQRRIVLDAGLLSSDDELRRILIHELFHFVWVRLSNPVRRGFEQLVAAQRSVPGELGWSAEYRKHALTPGDVRQRSRKWREYCCEAFCDTAAYIYARSGARSGVRSRRHSEFTLPRTQRQKRIAWFGKNLGSGNVFI